MRTGIDLVYIPKIKKFIKNKRFLERVFTEREISEFKERNFNPKHIAACWGAKEAFSKSIGIGIFEAGLKNISLLHNAKGRPYIEYTGDLKIIESDVTISHEGDYCVVLVKTKTYRSNRKVDTNKGDYGRLGIIAGSIGMTGAVSLSAMAAMRTGLGLCYVFSPSKIMPVLQSKLTEPVFIYTGAEKNFTGEDVSEVLEKSKKLDAAVIGCGLSQENGVGDFVRGFIREFKRPLVIDADGLNVIAPTDLRGLNAVITPHPLEFSRLTGIDVKEIEGNRVKYAREFAGDLGVCVVLKGHNTVVANSSGEVYINHTGNAGMATGGSGDVLSGMLGAMIAQGEEVYKAAVRAVRLHGLAGDYGALKYGETSIIASDLIKMLPKVMKRENE